MSKLVVLNLGKGTLQDGFPHVSVQLQDENTSNWKQFQGSLPAAPNIIDLYRRWQLLYDLIYEARSINIGLRNSLFVDDDITIDNADVTHVSDAEFYQVCEELQNKIDNWLDAEDFRNIDRQLRMRLDYNDEIRVIISTENIHLRRLPWHVWRFFRDYTQAEVALSPIEFEAEVQKNNLTQTIRILAILGDSTGIDINEDRKLLSSLPSAETIFLVEPKRQQLNELLWDEQGWNILFFAGHSSTTDGETGNIYINSTESLTITQLRNALKKAITNGLQLAIFNSCDGLGLARQLDDLHIPQIIVMREPVPDKVAQEFLKHFLMGFASGKSFYLAVREAREQLQGLESEFPGASWLPVICQNPAVTPLTWGQMSRLSEVNALVTAPNQRIDKPIKSKVTHRRTIRKLGRTVVLISIAVAIVVCSFRHSGILQPLELQVFDQMMRMRTLNEKPDDRLLVITVTEEDLKYQDEQGMQRQGSLSDAALAQILAKLEPLKPSVIGLDIYRDFPVQQQQVALTEKLRENENFFAICKHSDPQLKHPGIAPPAGVASDRLGFSDVVTDSDGIIRRYLFYMSPNLDSPCPTETSLGMQLALRYLEKTGEKITPEIKDDGRVQLNRITLPILTSHWGGYQGLDAAGYQIMLNYRRSRNIAKNATLTEILQGNFDPNLVKDRVVIIGTTAPSYEDNLYTSFSLNRLPDQSVRGVYIQAEMVSQILSTYLNRRPTINVIPTSLETFWIWIWSLLGSGIALYFKKPLALVLITGLTVCMIFTFYFSIFEVQSTWIPFIPAGLSIISTVFIVAILRTLKPN
jgi:CHASE2 domain-containing sensor protein